MKMNVIALYAGEISPLVGQAGVVVRGRGDRIRTQIECDVVEMPGGSVAKPRRTPSETAGPPLFRIQIDTVRPDPRGPAEAAVPLQPGGPALALDPEQRLLAPIFNNGKRLIFEFQRAEVLFLSRDGKAEVRLVAVHPDTGEVGTETLQSFQQCYAKLAVRVAEYLRGSLDLSPPRPSSAPRVTPAVPGGRVNLSFAEEPAAPDPTTARPEGGLH